MNTELLLKVRETILQNEIKFHMNHFVNPYYELETDEFQIEHCNTTFCIGGWAIYLHNQTQGIESRYGAFHHRAAERILNLIEIQATKLFYVDEWPEQWQDKMLQSNHPAQIAADYILYFIGTYYDQQNSLG